MYESDVIIQFDRAQKKANDLGFSLKALHGGNFELSRKSIDKRTAGGFSTKSQTLNEINAFLYGVEFGREKEPQSPNSRS